MMDVQNSCQYLLKECQNNVIYHSQSRLKDKNYAMSELRRKISTSKMINRISPQQQEENNRIITKMRKKYHKKQKESSIKKTDLGEDMLTFTKQEFQKLQFIDQCQEKNIIYRENIQSFDQDNKDKMSAVDRLKKMGKIQDIVSEVQANMKWGEMKQGQEKKYYFKFKQNKCFMPRNAPHRFTNMFSKLTRQSQGQTITKKDSVQKYYTTLLNKNSFNKNFLNSEPVWGKQTDPSLSFSEKIEMIKDEASQNLAKICESKHLYMTEQRKNALYECQILRLSKKILGNKQFDRLHFSIDSKEGQIQKQEMNREHSIQSQSKNCEAQEILQKNYKRIKAQRKRVIQKLLC